MWNLPPSSSLTLLATTDRFRRCASGVLLLALWLLVVTGCKSGPSSPKLRNYDVKVNLDSILVDKSVVVDVIGVNSLEFEQWQSYSISAYWSENDALRRNSSSVRHTFTFSPSNPLSQSISGKDPIWLEWKKINANKLIVIGDLPMSRSDAPGGQNPARKILSLNAHDWKRGSKTLEIQVQESGLRILTPPSVQ